MRRSLQKFETLTKALSKIKGAAKVINLAGEEPADAKATKLPKIQPPPPSALFPSGENLSSSPPELLNQLALLDHLLQLPSEQLRASAHRAAAVPRADLNQPSQQRQAAASYGVSLFSSAAALADAASISSPGEKQQGAPPGSPSRRVQFLAADAGFERVHTIPSRGELRAAENDPFPKPPAAKLSPRTRAIKTSSNSTGDAGASSASSEEGSSAAAGANVQGKLSRGKDGMRGETKAVYSSMRLGHQGKVVPAAPAAHADKAAPSPERVFGGEHGGEKKFFGGKGKRRL